MYVVLYCSKADLHWDMLGVLLRDVNLGEGETIYWLQWKDISRSVYNVFQGQAVEDVTQSSCWEATVDPDFLHHFCNFLCETTLLPFGIPFRVPAFPAFRLSQLPADLTQVKVLRF